jgi:hypothetical protein
MAQAARGSLARRFALGQNARKVRALERKVVANVDLVSAIADEDLAALQVSLPREQAITLTPGYAGPIVGERFIGDSTPRRVVVVGSFHWQPKQENLARFVERADPVFRQHEIQLDIVGEVPRELLTRLQAQCHATTFHGFLDNMAPLLDQARIAVVPELIGGGFKLKFLDYFFARVPVATLAAAAAGLPVPLRTSMIAAASLDELVASIVTSIDGLDRLNHLQDRAFHLARSLFRWEDRGLRLKHAIAHVQHRWAQSRACDAAGIKRYAPRIS